jgi:fatty-acyl-CoA synthase
VTASAWPADATIGDLLRATAGRIPDSCALVWATAEPGQRRRWTYAEMLADAEAMAGWLLTRFDPGDRLAVWAPSRPEWVQLQLGAALAGLILVPLNPAFRGPEARYVLAQSRATGVVFQAEHRGHPIGRLVDELAPNLPELRHVVSIDDLDAARAHPQGPLPAVRPGDVAQIQYTSGTTGAAKGAVLLHRGFTATIRMAVELMELGPSPVWLNVMPLFHIGGCGLSTIGPIALGGTHLLAERFDPTVVLQLIEQERATFFGSVPTMLLSLLGDPTFPQSDLSSLRVVLSGGAPVAPSLVRRIEDALGVRFLVAYGQTEAHGHVTQTRPDDSDVDKAETVGRPLPGIELKVVDPATGQRLANEAVGELWIRSQSIMAGYFEKPVETAAALTTDGWLRTGDLGSMDDRGVVRFSGRVKEMINRGGENIHPPEIEDVLGSHPAVEEVAVVGIPDEHWGEQVGAAVRLKPGQTATEKDLIAYLESRLAPHKVPRSWRFVDELPHTASGKVQKFVLRERWAALEAR